MFLEKAGLVYPGDELKPDRLTVYVKAQYAAETHTHFQTAGDGQQRSARLDRLYIGIQVAKYVRGVVTEEPLCRTVTGQCCCSYTHQKALLE
jgi:hypothetical protein